MTADVSIPPPASWSPLTAPQRRVLGVLIEKQKTTPDAYPMSVAALVAGCNQKSNRDPVSNYDADDLEEILLGLRHKGVVVVYEGTGRVPRWKHNAYEWLSLRHRPKELAVLAELLLRGPQTVGELRSRASRMDEIADLSALETILQELETRGLVVVLSPPGQKRGVVVTHGLYPPEELEQLRSRPGQWEAAEPGEAAHGTEHRGRAGMSEEVAALKQRVESLEQTVAHLAAEIEHLKHDLGD